MRDLATEANAREYISNQLDLTDSTKKDIGITKVFRLRRNTEQADEIV